MLLSSVIILIFVTIGDCQRNKLHLYEPEVLNFRSLPKEQWFVQKLDHFKPSDTRTWKQRFYVNETFFKASTNSPVFLMIGGEGEASSKWMVAGAWIEYAREFGALCFQLEHRYYGMSRPTKNMSTENLQYLNSEQALADLAYFTSSMNNDFNLTPNNKWIAFGGSYPGSLAAWLRYKYPHLIHAAISSSGPLLAKADFKEYNEVVKDSLNTFGHGCATQVKLANKHLTKLLTDPAGSKIITTKFRLCNPIDVDNKNDTANLAQNLADNIAGVVQYNKDNRMTSSPSSNITIDDLCIIMTNETIGTPLDRYAAINNMMMRLSNTTCKKHEYKEDMKEMQNITWSEGPSQAGRQWFYQTCVEFGFYQTSTSDDELFGPNFPLEFYTQQCSDAYGEGYNENLLTASINRTNIYYGDLHLKVSRVVFVHGSIDPWHALGITNSRNSSNPVIFIKGTAHCANMYPSKETDPAELKAARTQIRQYISKWLAITD